MTDKRIRFTPADLHQLVTICDIAIYGGRPLELEAPPMLAKAIRLRDRILNAANGKRGRPNRQRPML